MIDITKFETGTYARTPRGLFEILSLTRKQAEAAGFGYHHSSTDGAYLVMADGTRAFAIKA